MTRNIYKICIFLGNRILEDPKGFREDILDLCVPIYWNAVIGCDQANAKSSKEFRVGSNGKQCLYHYITCHPRKRILNPDDFTSSSTGVPQRSATPKPLVSVVHPSSFLFLRVTAIETPFIPRIVPVSSSHAENSSSRTTSGLGRWSLGSVCKTNWSPESSARLLRENSTRVSKVVDESNISLTAVQLPKDTLWSIIGA